MSIQFLRFIVMDLANVYTFHVYLYINVSADLHIRNYQLVSRTR